MQDTKDWSLFLRSSGAVTGALGKYQQGVAESELARRNAEAANQQALVAIERGRFEERRIHQELSKLLGSQEAAYASQNVALSKGTPLAVRVDSARLAELDVLTARNNAALEALGYRRQGAGFRYQSKVARRVGVTGAYGSLAVGAARAYEIENDLAPTWGVSQGSFGGFDE